MAASKTRMLEVKKSGVVSGRRDAKGDSEVRTCASADMMALGGSGVVRPARTSA